METLDRNLRSRKYSNDKRWRFQERERKRIEKRNLRSQLDLCDSVDIIFNEKETVDDEFDEMIRYLDDVKKLPPSIRKNFYPFNQISKLLEDEYLGSLYHITEFYGYTLN